MHEQMESVYYSFASIVSAKDCVRVALFLFFAPQTLQKVEKAHALRGIFRLIVPKVEESAFFTLWQASNLVECWKLMEFFRDFSIQYRGGKVV